ncbi:MAG: FHA domain-containing protein [Planctomycetes bacterium]|nr:FHA domain-containing protein [Planctomycetota bacterium]
MMIRLQHTRADGEVDTYHLKAGRRYHLGRGSACEVRLLDLKLSRKHAVIEFADGGWRIEDLCSTNGCRVNGQQIVGPTKLSQGVTIEIGQTALSIARIFTDQEEQEQDGQDEEPVAVGAPVIAVNASNEFKPVTDAQAVVGRDGKHRTPVPLTRIQQEAMPDDGDEKVRSTESELSANDWEPEPETEHLNKTGALMPIGKGAEPPPRPAPVVKSTSFDVRTPVPHAVAGIAPERAAPPAQPPAAPPPARPASAAAAPSATNSKMPAAPVTGPKIKPVTIRVGHVDPPYLTTPTFTPVLGEAAAAAVPPDAAAAPNAERSFFITVLGRRIGPLSRADARELKSRELKGVLTLADLETYPRA